MQVRGRVLVVLLCVLLGATGCAKDSEPDAGALPGWTKELVAQAEKGDVEGLARQSGTGDQAWARYAVGRLGAHRGWQVTDTTVGNGETRESRVAIVRLRASDGQERVLTLSVMWEGSAWHLAAANEDAHDYDVQPTRSATAG